MVHSFVNAITVFHFSGRNGHPSYDPSQSELEVCGNSQYARCLKKVKECLIFSNDASSSFRPV